MTERWTCLFEGRAGAKARAVFASEQQAREFAERHAQTTDLGVPLRWSDTNDTNDGVVLTTHAGEYHIKRSDDD